MCINVNWCPAKVYFGSFTIFLYIDDLNVASEHCKVHHFADHTNLLCANSSIKKLNKLLNKDLKILTNWF